MDYLDALRGIAAVAVALYHYVLSAYDNGLLHGVSASIGSAISYNFNLGKAGVVLFFLISGFIIPQSIGTGVEKIPQFIISRFFRLYPLYWIVLAAGVFLPYPVTDTFTRSDILADVTMVQGFLGHKDVVGAFWTLQIELVFYFCCVVLVVLGRMRSVGFCAAVSAGCFVVALLMAIARNVLVMKLPLALPLALGVMFFGAVWRQARLEGSPAAQRIAPWLLGGMLTIIFPISIIGYNHDFGFHERWDTYVSCYTMAIVVFVICTTKMRLSGRPFVWLGKISYSIYLVHPLVASAAIQAGYGPEAVAMNPLVYSVVLVAVVILVAWITYSLIEYPAIRFGKRVAARREATLQQPAVLQIAAQKAG